MTSRLLILLGALAALPSCRCNEERPATSRQPAQPPAAAREDAAPDRPRLVVLVVIDQLPSWSFSRSAPHLSGGLGRLVREGVFYPEAEIPYSNTFTAVGHAAIATGAPPRETGILANAWHMDGSLEQTGCTDDPESPVLGPRAEPGEGESSRRLQVEGVADMLERATGGAARTVSISLKDRAAILTGGRKPDLALWWDPAQALMTTSRYYAAERPAWLDPAQGLVGAPDRFLAATWEPRDPAACAALTGAEDDQAGEGGNHGLGKTFPHPLTEVEQPGKAILNTPFATEILFETATAALRAEKLGADEVPDLLAISVSSHDYAGHGWGQESWECADVLLDIDRRLGDLFELLDAEIGEDRWAALLTSDHGAQPLNPAAGTGASRDGRHHILKEQAVGAAQKAAARVLGGGQWAHALSANIIQVTPAFSALPAEKKAPALEAMVKALQGIPGMGLVAPVAELAGDCARHQEPVRRRACLSLPPGGGEGIVALAGPGSQYVGDHPFGAGHGGDSAEERVVPVVIRAPGRAPARHEGTVSFLRVAPTLSALLGVPPPPAATEPPL
ncbi:MAG TPA: alkaline phosphatase family protein [Kofleriaceae bacterium]|nr:alkaline phosphatase family protein [Kofleriaceae bacterium]